MIRFRSILTVALSMALISFPSDATADFKASATPTAIDGVKVDREAQASYEPRGVSSFAFIDKAGLYWLFANSGQGVQAHTSTDGRTWTRESGWKAPGMGASDITIVNIDSGYRMYYAEMASNSSGGSGGGCSIKRVKSATSTDLRNWTVESGVRLENAGCGVPQVVRNPSGGWHLYYVASQTDGHGTQMATSADGLTFTKRSGLLIGEDLVDPSVVVLADGTWLMAWATFPTGPQRQIDPYQYLGLASSPDGLTWTRAKAYLPGPQKTSQFDPTVLVLPDSRIRLYFSEATNLDLAKEDPYIRSSILTLGPSVIPTSTPTATPSATVPTTSTTTSKQKTITCVKGKVVRKVSGTNPKCPAGFKIKK